MNPQAYELMSEMEERHWWYRGLRGSIARTLNRRRFRMRRGANILDAGCGTGGNLRFLRQLLQPTYLGGFDFSPLAVRLAKQKTPDADVYQGDICAPEIHVKQLDLILSCDVLYSPGFDAAVPGLQQLVAKLSPGGIFVLNLPAYDWLYSEHDVAIHTSERYTASKVRGLLERLGLKVELVTYRMFFLFPALVMARLPSILRTKPSKEMARSDLSMPSKPINFILSGIMGFENAGSVAGVRYPWGSSVFAVARKV